MKDLLKDVISSTKKTENIRKDEKDREEDSTFFAPGSTPQYKVIYKDMCEVASSSGSADRGRVEDRGRYAICTCMYSNLEYHKTCMVVLQRVWWMISFSQLVNNGNLIIS
jgi:hypothetical protein